MSIYEMVTDRIISELEKGRIPWRKPWNVIMNGECGAISYTTRKPYSLLNQMLLSRTGEYLTFNQVQTLKGKVKKGVKSEFVVFWKMQKITEEINGETKEKQIPLLRYYNVFHISDCEGIKSKLKEVEKIDEVPPIVSAEKIKEEYSKRENITIREIMCNEAFYSSSGDFIQVPVKEQFDKVEEFYSTLFHEMVHSTMKANRCNREDERKGKSTRFGSHEYSKEELVAEIGSVGILTTLNIETNSTFKNSTAYIQSWIKQLKDDSRFIISASSKAEKAMKYIFYGNVAEELEDIA